MSKRMVSYDFDVQSIVAVDTPYGTDPDTLIGQALVKLIQRARHEEIELVCENIFDGETGAYEDVPDEWYKGRNKLEPIEPAEQDYHEQTLLEKMEDEEDEDES